MAPEEESYHLPDRCPGRHLPTGDLPEATNNAHLPRDHERAVLRFGLLDLLPERPFDARPDFLDLDVDRRLRELLVNLFQGRDGDALTTIRVNLAVLIGEIVAGVEALDLPQRHLP